VLTHTDNTAQASQEREVPKALVSVLNSAEKAMKNGDPAAALKIINAYTGKEDALHALMQGHALQELKRLKEAEKAYQRSLKLDKSLHPAKLGLAQVLVDQRKWTAASKILGEVVNLDKGTSAEIGLYARVAYELKDLRLASLLVERAIIRFPQDTSFRRLDIALLMERGETKEAYEAAKALLAKRPNDKRAWKQLAAITESDAQPHRHLAALEAALLVNENDLNLQKRYAMAQYQAGHYDEALSTVAGLNKSSKRDLGLVQLGVRIAEESDQDQLAQKWLNKVPERKRTKTLTLLEARLAIKSGQKKKARSALDRLIKAGAATPNVLLWAGQLAEQTGAFAKAESLYQQASHMTGSSGRLAVLHLARLLHRINQIERASQLLSTYLAKHPDDEPARELLAVITQRNRTNTQN
jgi:predicted Zn-dependent protease